MVSGYMWDSYREPSTKAFIFFGDGLIAGDIVDTPSDPALPPASRADFDTPAGKRALPTPLARYEVTITR